MPLQAFWKDENSRDNDPIHVPSVDRVDYDAPVERVSLLGRYGDEMREHWVCDSTTTTIITITMTVAFTQAIAVGDIVKSGEGKKMVKDPKVGEYTLNTNHHTTP